MNIEEIDKWLDNEYGVSYTELEKLHDFVVDRDREHQEQKDKTINDLLKRISNLEFEIERLNNIIEEIREYTKHKIVECYDEGSTIGEFYKICDIDSKIEELLHKGEDKE